MKQRGNRISDILSRVLPGSEDSLSLWMLPYCTLMVVLMILFSALYAYSYYDAMLYEQALAEMKGGSVTVSPSVKEVLLAQKIDEFIKEMKMEGIADVMISPHSIKLQLSSPAIFDSASAELRPELMPLLIKLYEHLRNMDNTVVVEGYTDNIPIHTPRFRSNWELSAARAFSVIHFYLQRGIAPERLVAHGYGEHRPFFPNNTEIGRAMNRRIEITILRERPAGKPAQKSTGSAS